MLPRGSSGCGKWGNTNTYREKKRARILYSSVASPLTFRQAEIQHRITTTMPARQDYKLEIALGALPEILRELVHIPVVLRLCDAAMMAELEAQFGMTVNWRQYHLRRALGVVQIEVFAAPPHEIVLLDHWKEYVIDFNENVPAGRRPLKEGHFDSWIGLGAGKGNVKRYGNRRSSQWMEQTFTLATVSSFIKRVPLLIQ